MSRSNAPVLDAEQHTTEQSYGPSAPLISVADLSETSFPTVPIPDNRYLPLTEHGTRRARNSPGTTDNHIQGILGEFALAELLCIPNQVDTQLYENGDPGYDLQYRGYTIDVKTTNPRMNNPQLMVDCQKQLNADFYVLVQEVGARHYQVLGYAPRCIVESAPVKEFGTVPGYNRVRIVDQDRLFPIPQPTTGQTGN